MREAFARVGAEEVWIWVVDDMVAVLLPKDGEDGMVLLDRNKLLDIYE